MVTILEYWREISVTLGGVAMFITGRKSAKFLEKKQQADAVTTMQNTYNLFLEHYEKQYKKLNEQVDKLQKSFLDLQLSYAKEIEVSQNWEKLHRELEDKYKDLEKLYERLKADFERYKKQAK